MASVRILPAEKRMIPLVPHGPSGTDAEVTIEQADGSFKTVLTSHRYLKNDAGEVTGAINCLYDITERKRAEELEAERRRTSEMRRYAQVLQQVQEEERGRIARDLHDDICQKLCGMKLTAEMIENAIRSLDKRLYRKSKGFALQCEQL